MDVELVPAYNFQKEVCELFSEYTDMLVEGDAAFSQYLAIQNYEKEMKRLYVRPQFRGRQIGNVLVRQIIEDAKEIGYRFMLLDTLPFLEGALHMYRKTGFYEIESYNDSPMENSIYMRLEL